MTPGALLAQTARDTLAEGPMSWTERREDHVRYLDMTFGDGRALLQGIAATHPASTCAIVVGMWAMLAGLQPKRRPPAAKAITTWAGFGGFSGRYWVPVAELVPEKGDVPYFCGEHPNGWQAAGDGHVVVLLEGEGWLWTTAEGGGGSDGTSCRVSATPKDIRTHRGRKLRGAWRPGGRPEKSVSPKPPSVPPKPTPVPPKPPIVSPKPPYVSPKLTGLVRGIDVSAHQNPKLIAWHKLAETHEFVYVRATYGTKVDESCAEHVTRARDVGISCGLYLFFRPGNSISAQLETFGDVHDALSPELAPVIDVEQNPKYDGEVTLLRYAPAEEVARGMLARWGRALLYTNPAMSAALGHPAWFKDLELWVAHYGVDFPKTPQGLPWLVWQHLVAPLPSVYAQDIDQDLARELPLLGKKPAENRSSVSNPLPLQVDWDQFERDRDSAVREEDEDA